MEGSYFSEGCHHLRKGMEAIAKAIEGHATVQHRDAFDPVADLIKRVYLLMDSEWVKKNPISVETLLKEIVSALRGGIH